MIRGGAAVAALALLTFAAPAPAQTTYTIPSQGQPYVTGQPSRPPTPITSAPASGGQAIGGGNVSGGAYDQLNGRIDQLENEVQDLTNQVEKANHDNAVLVDQIQRMQKDTDFRLKQLESASGGAAAGGNGVTPPVTDQQANPPGNPLGNQQGSAAPPANAPRTAAAGSGGAGQSSLAPKSLGTISKDDQAKFGGPPPPPTKPAAFTLQGKTPAEQYDYAFKLLSGPTPDFNTASLAFAAFVTKNPNDPLVGNAKFWLGDIAFRNQDYSAAIPNFADVYSKYPKSPKAGEALLDLGLSMEQVKKPKEACIALTHFTTDFQDSAASLKARATAARKRLTC